MSDAALIKEFLVGLGFKLDEPGLKKTDNALEKVSKQMAKVGFAAAAVGAAVTAFVDRVADSMEKLYFASKRTGAAIENIKAFGYAAAQLGSTAESALSSLEGLSSFMRNNPGANNFLVSLGVSPSSLRDATKVMDDLTKVFRRLNAEGKYYLANRYAQMLGIDEKTLMAMIQGMDQFKDRYQSLYKLAGISANEVGEASNRFKTAFRSMAAALEVLSEKIMLALAPVAEHIVNFVSRVVEGFLEITNVSPAVRTAILVVAAALGLLLSPITTIAAGILLLIEDFEAFKEGGKSFINWGSALKLWHDPLAWIHDQFVAIRDIIDNIIQKLTNSGVGRWVRRQLGIADTAQTGSSVPVTAGNTGSSVPVTAGNTGSSALGRQAMEYFQNAGWTRAQAAGIVANLGRESNFNPSAVGDGGKAYGIAQWHPDRQAAFKSWTGKDIQQSTFAEQLAFVNYELTQGAEKAAGAMLRMAGNANQAGAIVSRNYERPANMFGEATLRGSMAERWERANISQSTTINIHGASDPHAVAQTVGSEQSRVNNTLLRNVQGAVR